MKYDQINWLTLLKGSGCSADVAALWAPFFTQAIDEKTFVGGDHELSCFLSEALHESAMLTKMSENLNYRADRLVPLFGSGRITQEQASKLGRIDGQQNADQKGIANVIYGGEWGKKNLGNTEPNDGWDFRGSALIEITGRANFRAAGQAVGRPYEQQPDLLRIAGPDAVRASLAWWHLNIPAALLSDPVAIRKRVNSAGLGTDQVLVLMGTVTDVLKSL